MNNLHSDRPSHAGLIEQAERGVRMRARGQSIVEFALIMPALLLLVLGTFDLGRGVAIYNSLTNAARQGAHYAALKNLSSCTYDGINTDCNAALATALAAAPLVNRKDISSFVVTTSGSHPVLGDTYYVIPRVPTNSWNVTIAYTFHPTMLFVLGGIGVQMRASGQALQH